MFGSTAFHKKNCYNSLDWAQSELYSVPHGTLFTADYHELTVGRQGRIWHYDPGQLLATYVIKPPTDLVQKEYPALLMALGLGVQASISQYTHNCFLKWPNDCIIKTKKVAGILARSVWNNTTLNGIIIGIGINVNNSFSPHSELFSIATSIYKETNLQTNKHALLRVLNEQLTEKYKAWLSEPETIFPRYHESLCTPKRSVLHLKNKKAIRGEILSYNPDGSLIFKESETDIINRYTLSDVQALI